MKDKTKIKTKTVTNDKKKSIEEHLISNKDYANNYMLSIYRLVNYCSNTIDLMSLEAKSMF